MKILSLITEYNPLHNGHLYHIEQAKKVVSPDVTIVIMSGNFTQRGELAVINKFDRAKEVIKYVDLVVELPVLSAISYADDFARGALHVSNTLGTTDIVFGSESGNILSFKKAIKDEKNVNQDEVLELVKKGISYPRAMEKLTGNSLLTEPNNTLGLSYIKAIDEINPNITPHTIKRMGSGYHEFHQADEMFQSATGLREILKNKDEENAEKFMPYELARKIIAEGVKDNEVMFPTLKTIILRSTLEELRSIYMMTEGLENRLKQCVKKSTSYKEFLTLLKTKRYTWTRLSRLLIYVLLNIKKSDIEKQFINAIRVLAMNATGQHYISTLKNKNIYTNINKRSSTYFENEIKATDIYNTLTHTTMNDFNTPVVIYRKK